MAANTYNAFVLHRIPYRETSYLVDVFTLEQGKFRGVAKGVRGSKSDRKSLLQSFQLLEVTVSGRNELKNIGRIEAKSHSLNLPERTLFCAMYINELMNRVLPESLPVEELFLDYQTVLGSLTKLDVRAVEFTSEIETLLRSFEIQLLTTLGYMPDLAYCSDSGLEISDDCMYEYVGEQGVRQLKSRAQKNSYSGTQLRAISQAQWDASSLKAAKSIMRQALKPLLGEKPLKSRELFSGIR